jgi:DNA-directed RNA polymerase specialized sigma24 family protein
MGELPPEIAALTKEEVRAAYQAALLFAIRIMKSNEAGQELVQRAFERLLTTRRWKGGSLEQHLIGIVMSLRNIEYRSKREEREANLHEGYHREVAGFAHASHEDAALDRAEIEQRRMDAEDDLARLEAAVAHHTVAVGMLRLLRAEPLKAAAVAERLGVPVAHVYRAKELVQYHLEKIRKARGEPRS